MTSLHVYRSRLTRHLARREFGMFIPNLVEILIRQSSSYSAGRKDKKGRCLPSFFCCVLPFFSWNSGFQQKFQPPAKLRIHKNRRHEKRRARAQLWGLCCFFLCSGRAEDGTKLHHYHKNCCFIVEMASKP